MRFNYRKIASVVASAVMLTSTIGFAAAANYPAPFSSTGGAVVYGSDAAKTDVIAAMKVANSVRATAGGTVSTATCSGECGALFTGATKIYINDSLNSVKTVLTSTDLPTVLAKSTFSGNVDATVTETLDIGSHPRLLYSKQPTSSDDPTIGFTLGTNAQTQYVYNATASFSRAVNFTDATSKNRELDLFGEKYTVGSATSATDLVLLKSSSTLYFDSSGTTSEEVTVGGQKYTVELTSASDTSATIKVTNEAGVSALDEVTKGGSPRKINGLSVGCITATSNNLKFTASITVGADKITLTDGSAVSVGDSGTTIDGTFVRFVGTPANLTKISVSVAAPSSEKDAINPGSEFTDPVFGSFKVSLAGGLNIAQNDSVNRETYTIQSAGDDKLQVKLTNKDGKEATISYVKTRTQAVPSQLQWGDDGLNITVVEGAPVFNKEYVMVGNEDNGYLLKVSITNSSSSDPGADKVTFTNVFNTDEVFTSTQSSEGVGTVQIGGKSYTVRYYANDPNTQDDWNVSIDYPDSAAGEVIAYPTFNTAKGAKAFFYEPVLSLNLNSYAIGNAAATVITKVKVPNGNGYTDLAVTGYTGDSQGIWNIGGSNVTTNSTTSHTGLLTVGQLKYRFQGTGTMNVTNMYLVNPSDNSNITVPSFALIEEKDDNSQYQAVILTTTPGTSSTNATRVNDVYRTWSADTQFNAITWASNSNKQSDLDLFGTVITKDTGDSNHPKMEISYPDEQVYANVYIAKADSVIVPGGGTLGATGGLTSYEDTALDSYKDMNLVVVGGSCVNRVAAKIIKNSEDPVCGADFTTETQVGPTQYIIKTVKSPYNDAKVAVLVAGYEAADTVTAVDTLLAGASTDLDSSKVYPELTA